MNQQILSAHYVLRTELDEEYVKTEGHQVGRREPLCATLGARH